MNLEDLGNMMLVKLDTITVRLDFGPSSIVNI